MNAAAPTIALTGASGFIGGAVVDALLARGWHVRALVRRAEDGRRLEARGVASVAGSLADAGALAALSDGVDAVVHCAGAVRGARYADFKRVNADGTAALLAALAKPATPIIALSSLAARKPMISDYARSKRALEDVLADRAEGQGPWAALRPPPVYGPGDRALAPLFAAFARGVAPIPGDRRARLSLIFVTDLAAAIAAWLQSPAKPSGVFALHDGRPGGYSWREIVAAAETLRGRPIRALTLGRWLSPIARANLALAGALGYAPMLTPGKVRELRDPDWVCDNRAIQSAIAWQPRVDLTAGLARTRRWR